MKNYTFFKAVYYRHTHFSRENIIEDFENNPEWNYMNHCKLSKVGDLIKTITIKIDIKINDYLYENVDEKKELYSDEYLSNFVFINENKLNEYINKVVAISNLNDYNKKLIEMNLLDMIEILKNFSKNASTSYSHSDSTSNSNFKLDMNYIDNNHIDEYNSNPDIDIKYTILNESFSFKNWDYFKLYCFMKYYETIEDLNFLYVNDSDIVLKKDKIKSLKNLEIFKLLDLKKKIKWKNNISNNIIQEVILEIGGEEIFSYDNLFYDIYSCYNKEFNSKIYENMSFLKKDDKITIYLPILINDFYIPCIALKYNEIVLNVKINDLEKLCETDCKDIKIERMSLLIDYIYLSEKERNLFCTQKLYYLINTTEKIISSIDKNDFTIIDLELNKICKQLYWFIYDSDTNEFIESENNTYELLIENEIIGNKRLDNKYYNYIEPWKTCNYLGKRSKEIMLYNFSLFPFKNQPSGFIDFKNYKSKKMIFYDSKIYEYKKIIIISSGIRIFKIENGFMTSII